MKWVVAVRTGGLLSGLWLRKKRQPSYQPMIRKEQEAGEQVTPSQHIWTEYDLEA